MVTNMVNIALHRIYYPVLTLGYGKRLGVWVQGCARHCPGCLSPETWAPGCPVPLEDIESLLARSLPSKGVDGLTISGGEPFDQPHAVRTLVGWFGDRYGDDILIYTGYTLQELRQRPDPHTQWLLTHAAAVIDGPYVASRNDGKGLRGSDNQTVTINHHARRHENLALQPRQLQCVELEGTLCWFGVPPQAKGGDAL